MRNWIINNWGLVLAIVGPIAYAGTLLFIFYSLPDALTGPK